MAKPGTQDFRSLKPTSGQKGHARGSSAGNDTRDWWAKKGAQAAQTISAVVGTLQSAQAGRIRQQVVFARQYGNTPFGSAQRLTAQRLLSARAGATQRQDNETQSIIDTLQSRVGETKPRPYFQLSAGGDYKQHRKVSKLNQFVEGVFYEAKTYTLGPEAFRDSAIQGDGFIYVFGRGGKIRQERVWGSELWVDEVEGQYGSPRNMHRLKDIDVHELAGYFPESRAEIMRASRANDSQRNNTTSDMVTVCESWHLGSMNEDGELVGGKHAITLMATDHMLVEPEEWPHPFFPFARISWCKRPIGYWSQGLCEQLQGWQIRLNRANQFIDASLAIAGGLKILMENGSKIVTEQFNNEIGTVIKYSGVKPEYYVPQPIHQIYLDRPQRIRENMRNLAGVSQMALHGTKPADLESGAALREMDDIESARHKTIQVANNAMYIELALLTVCIASEMAKAGKLAVVRNPRKGRFNEIDWNRDIKDVATDEFTVQCCDVSRLPKEPAGRLATIEEWIQAGWLNAREGRRAMEFSEKDTWESLQNAAEDLIISRLDAIIDEGRYSPPEPTDDLALSQEITLDYLHRYSIETMKVESEKLDMLRTYLSQVNTLLKKGEEQAIAAQVATQQAIAPPAAPLPPPRSALLPNTRTQPGGAVNALG